MDCEAFPNSNIACPYCVTDHIFSPPQPTYLCPYCLIYELHIKRQAELIARRDDQLLSNICDSCG